MTGKPLAENMPANCPRRPEPIPEKDGIVEMLRASLAQHPNAKKAKKGTR